MSHRIFLFLITTLLLCSCTGHDYYCITGYAQGGTYIVKCSEGDITPQKLKAGIDSILGCIDRAVSGYNPQSILSIHNRGEKVKDTTSAEYLTFKELTAISDSISSLTGGVVDSRSAALYDVWGFGFKESKLPSQDAVQAAMKDRSKLNFNAIAQGYSSDKVAEYLREHKVENMLVNIGGEMYCLGWNPSKKGWSIGIDAPFDGNMSPGKDMAATLTLKSPDACGVVTSGNYRKFYVIDSVKYSHTIDPRSGRPVQHNLLSATIMAPTSTMADALATYCMVVGTDSARTMITNAEGVEGCLIATDTTWFSEGFPISNQ